MNIPLADTLLEAWVKGRVRAAGGVAPLESLDLAALERVLLVLTTGLGDAVLSTPVFPALRRALPGARIGLFVRSAWSSLFEADPDLDAVIPYHGKYRRFFATLAGLRRFAPQLALVLHGNDPDIVPMLYLAGSRYIVRIPTEGTRYRALLANAGRAADAATLQGVHYVDNRLRVLDTVGIPRVTGAPRVHLPESSRARVAALVGTAPYWVYHAFAADAYKVWPADLRRAFLERAQRELADCSVILSGTANDRGPLELLAAGLPRARVIAGEASLTETAAVLAGARCVVAPDTGVLHLAAALDRPVVGLYAPTFATLVGPRAEHAATIAIQKPQTCVPCVDRKCPYAAAQLPQHCMRQITVDEVLGALARQLAGAQTGTA